MPRLVHTALTILALATPALAQPNVVFILVDDLGWTDVGYNGSTFYDTPSIDALAARATVFTNAYAACPVCSPTRASIMTGKYPARLNTTDYFGAPQPDALAQREGYDRPLLPAPYLDRLPLDETTIAEALKSAGYATFFAGKWHLGPEGFWPEDQGFDVNKGGITRGGPYGGKKYFSPYGNPRLDDGPEGEHLPQRLADETARFIADHADQPFLAYLAFYSVHTPLMGRPDLVARYQAKRERRGLEPQWGAERTRRVRLVQEHAVYAAMVEAVDQAVGTVLDAVEEAGLADDTVVILMSDNGGLSTSEGHPTSNLPLRAGKGWLYEGGIREPMLILWPGVTTPGSRCDTPVTSTDFYPTILDVTGQPPRPDQHADGRSLAPLLRDPGASLDRDALYWHYPHYGNQGGAPSGAIRKGDWKLIEWYEDGTLELFDLANDIGEQHNVAPDHPDIVEELHARLDAWRNTVDARMPTPRR